VGSQYSEGWITFWHLLGGKDSRIATKDTKFAPLKARGSLSVIQHDGQLQRWGSEMKRFIVRPRNVMQAEYRRERLSEFAPIVDFALDKD
jgi:hypothetical protein